MEEEEAIKLSKAVDTLARPLRLRNAATVWIFDLFDKRGLILHMWTELGGWTMRTAMWATVLFA